MFENTSIKSLKPSCLGAAYPNRKDNTYPSRKDRGWSIRKDTNKYSLTIDFNNNPPLPPFRIRGDLPKFLLSHKNKEMKMEDRRLITEFEKNSVEKVKVINYDWKGLDLIDVRVWLLQNPADPKSEIPTKKGITIREESLP